MTARKATVQLAETFTISRGSEDEAHVIQVAIEHDGVSGHGEAAPIERYRESVESGLAWLEEVELPDNPFALDELAAGLPAGEQAARAALDHALHDLQGKLTGLPVYRLLGLRRAGPPTSWTIWLGDPDDMARRTERGGDRFRRLKLKLGARDGVDGEAVRGGARGRARPGGGSRHGPAAAGRRERGLGDRRGRGERAGAVTSRRPVRRA